jgi:mannose-6-phosphate isomerase-like protein (cupin superfamily)
MQVEALMLKITNKITPSIQFQPERMVYETIRFYQADFAHSTFKPPFDMICFQLGAGDATPKDRHDDVEIWIILSGIGKLVYDDNETYLAKNDMVYFEPNKFHQVFNISQEPLLICSLSWLDCAISEIQMHS